MNEKMTPYDPAAALTDDVEIAYFIADALTTSNMTYIAQTLEIAVRANENNRSVT